MEPDQLPYVRNAVKALFAGDPGGHDEFHTERVYRTAMKLADTEPCDRQIVALAALLHDVDDPKLFSTEANENARRILSGAGVAPETAGRIIAIINKVAYKGTDTQVPETIEGKIVQDADRLDAIGAIGIARAFAYGGSRGRAMYDPDIPPRPDMDEAAYRSRNSTTINHFYEKLLLLEGMMNTDCAKRMARARTQVMTDFLAEFLAEWNG